jgi:vacuolar-type H+-ATPase subunit I/STV1
MEKPGDVTTATAETAGETGMASVLERYEGMQGVKPGDAAVTEGDAAGDAAAEATETAETTAEATEEAAEETTEQLEEGEAKGLSEQARREINGRFGKLTALRRAAEEKAASAEERATAAEALAKAAQERLDSGLFEVAAAAGVHPDYVEKTELDVITAYDQARKDREAIEDILDGMDGDTYTTPGGKEFTRREIRARLRAVEAQIDGVSGKALAARERAAREAEADRKAGRELRLKGKAPAAERKPAAAGKPGLKPPVAPAGAAGRKGAPVSARTERARMDSAGASERLAKGEDAESVLLDMYEGAVSG